MSDTQPEQKEQVQEQQEQITTLAEFGAKWEGFAWKDCTAEYNTTIQGMEAWEHRIINGLSVEEIMSAPEIMDIKTDLHHNWKDTKPLEILEKTKGALLDVSKLSDDELIDLMDAHFTLEQQLFVDNNDPVSAILYSVFAHKASLVEDNVILKAYMNAYYYDVFASLARVGTSQVADEDEFPVLEQAVDVLSRRSGESRIEVAALTASLEEAMTKTKNADILARLEHRMASLTFAVAISGTDIHAKDTLTIPANNAKVQALCAEVVTKISALNRKKNDEAAPTNKKVFMNDCFSWLRISIPNTGVKLCSFTRAKEIALAIHHQYKSVLSVFPMTDLIKTIHEFEAINCSKYYLASRALLSVIVSRQVTSTNWKELILASLENYGVTIFSKLLKGDKALLHEVLQFRVSQGYDEMKPEDERGFLEQVENIIVRLAISVHDFLRVMAHHRALTNRNIASMFQRTWDILNEAAGYDSVFGVLPSRTVPQQMPHDAKVQKVFYHWASILYSFAYNCYINTTVDLDLVTNAEFFGVVFLKIQGCRDIQDCLSSLIFTKAQPIPKKHLKMGNTPAVNPSVYTRTHVEAKAGEENSLALLEVRTQLEAHASQSMMLLGGVLEHLKILEFKGPKASLVSVSDVFNHRFGAVLGSTTRIPFYGLEMTHQQKDNMRTDILKAAEGKVKKVFADYEKNLANALVMLTKNVPGASAEEPALSNFFFADCRSTFTTNMNSLTLLKDAWKEDQTDEHNAMNIKDNFEVTMGYNTRYALPVLTVKAK